MMAGLFID